MATQAQAMTEGSERAWFGQLVAEARASNSATVLTLEQAAEWLYVGLSVLKYGLKVPRPALLKARREAMAEIEQHTRGQRFRIDTPAGVLFTWEGLHEFAGRCGPMEGPNDNPTWAAPSWAALVRHFYKRKPAMGRKAAA